MRVYIILINYNGAKDTVECIKSLFRIRYSDYRIIIVDNNSDKKDFYTLKDNLFKISKKANKEFIQIDSNYETVISFDVLLVSNTINKGFSGGNNVGIKYAIKDKKCEAIWFLNNDTVVDNNALISMIGKLKQQKEIGIIGSVLLEYNNPRKIQCVGGIYNFFTQRYSPVLAGKYIDKISFEKIDFSGVDISGASFLVRRSTLIDLNIFDEAYFLYCEELDVSAKCRKSSWRMMLDTDSMVYHKGSASIGKNRSPFKEYHAVRSKTIYMKKHQYPLYVLYFAFYVLFRVLFRLLISRDIQCSKSVIKGYIDGVKTR